MPSEDRHINFRLLRDRILNSQNGRGYWRSLDELADTDEFRELVEREFPQQAEEWDDAVSRRTFIKIMGASLAFAGLSGCSYQPPEKIVPYIRQPEEIVPGKALFFATAMTLGGSALGLLVKSNEGRPTKVEGNPDHPVSRGATDVFAQASILNLYDPDRSKTLTFREEIRPWTAFVADVRTTLDQQRATSGAGLRFLTETVVSPTLAHQLRTILAAYPAAKWHQYEPASSGGAHAGGMMALGTPVNTIYRFDQADRILSLDADFLSSGQGSVMYARDFAKKRRGFESGEGGQAAAPPMNRLYVVESTPSCTGAKADHRLPLKPSEMESFARAVAAALGVQTGGAGAPAYTANANWIAALARDLQQSRGRSIIIAGDEQPAAVHALAHAMNAALGNVGQTVIYTDPVEFNPVDQMQSLRELVGDMNAGTVDTLVILGGNPVYNAPADLNFAQAMQKVRSRIHLSYYKDETSELCHWHIPEAHYLESWSDTRAMDGTVTIVQPLVEPLFEGKTTHEVLAIFADQADRLPYDILRDYWRTQITGADFETAWRRTLHDGFVANTTLPAKTFPVKTDWTNSSTPAPSAQPSSPGSMEIVFRTDPTIYDGRFANNGWLQELPKPLTKITWDNAALISPATARRLGITREIGRKGGDTYVDVLELTYQGRKLRVPAWIMPGQADDVVTVHLGYGRARAGRVGSPEPQLPRGFNAYAIRTSDAPWSGTGLQVAKTADTYQICVTQLHNLMENRDVVHEKTLAEFTGGEKERPQAEELKELQHLSMYPRYEYEKMDYAWGMAIDLTSCVGCSACVVACQSENNIPVVGKEQIARSREMHWLRVDTYYKGAEDNPAGPYFMPVPCMHCENAPCEPVCPVHATVHSAEGLNDMVYNRCVGTRYCSNNCPYKVRRFNFLLYQDWETPTYQLMRNPEVTVRSRGVMEKCTYCVQRIQWAKIESELEGRKVRDGEILTACQAVCPTDAIVFGNVNDPNSRVSQLKKTERNYSLLADLNTQPRTTYLAEIRNPNPEIGEKA